MCSDQVQEYGDFGSGPVLASREGGIARITLNRPDRLNALTREMILQLRAALEATTGDQQVHAILITGAGRGFCAGQDLSERDPRRLSGPLDLEAIQRELYHPVIRLMRTTPKPIVAAVNGIAAGAGVGIALAADIAVAAESANLVFSFAKIGLSVDAGLGQTLVAALGMARARGLLMLGATLGAVEAARIGLIWSTVPSSELTQLADQLAQQLAATPRLALAGIKAATTASGSKLDDYLAIEAAQQGAAGAHPDYAEGVLSFLERRSPQFSLT